jgi:hypothetical protein
VPQRKRTDPITTNTQTPQQLAATIAAVEAQRALLGDAVVDGALAPLREKLAALRAPQIAAAAQQLKQVSVPFVGVVGSTAMGQQLDAETMHEVMDSALERFTAAVQADDGRVPQHTGDGMFAAFGTGAAGEGDVEAAIHAGLAIAAQPKERAPLFAGLLPSSDSMTRDALTSPGCASRNRGASRTLWRPCLQTQTVMRKSSTRAVNSLRKVALGRHPQHGLGPSPTRPRAAKGVRDCTHATPVPDAPTFQPVGGVGDPWRLPGSVDRTAGQRSVIGTRTRPSAATHARELDDSSVAHCSHPSRRFE